MRCGKPSRWWWGFYVVERVIARSRDQQQRDQPNLALLSGRTDTRFGALASLPGRHSCAESISNSQLRKFRQSIKTKVPPPGHLHRRSTDRCVAAKFVRASEDVCVCVCACACVCARWQMRQSAHGTISAGRFFLRSNRGRICAALPEAAGCVCTFYADWPHERMCMYVRHKCVYMHIFIVCAMWNAQWNGHGSRVRLAPASYGNHIASFDAHGKHVYAL